MAGYGGGYGRPPASGYGDYEGTPPYGHGRGEGRQEYGVSHGTGMQTHESSYDYGQEERRHGHGSSHGAYPQHETFLQPEHNRSESRVQGKSMSIFCEANPNFNLTVRGDRPVLAPWKENDPYQQWIKDERWGFNVKDAAGFPAFALVNKGSGLALRHGKEMNDEVNLHPYDPNSLDESLLWTQSADVGNGFQCIRPVGDINLNLDAHQGTAKYGGVKNGNPLILFKWKKQENQKWKITPIPSTGSDPASSYDRPEPHSHQAHGGHSPQQYQQHGYQNPPSQQTYGGDSQYVPPVRGQAVKLHCEAKPDFFVTARADGVVLAPGDNSDIRQVWIKDNTWSTKVKDEAGFPAFILINKATQGALKHGKAEFDEVELTSFNPNELDESILWTESADVGHGYKCIRPVGNINLNLDASHGDVKYGGVHDGTKLILFKWRKHENQKWNMIYV
ncbi:hypothetical protein O6H91_18G005500 [Diphasiastrum complanatum]|uniref:Uncharacterized protein n=8 Tax=Diphasiastrum complanatum TaxID=34168 RepID=A0ACC2AXX5_DIPCM|nr:hypothetical protein O6H91_18G005500 [Diphasiastrum complanatum]KAJ7522298.1 hypothetical protein O6H91_18G005500 [Diphasiastrum complanatum]KAJ7522299.1 hypothetical protein O6H91_18G005500 [Diphasiastrum complanatum]KAJ7522300.1 hypothetical protein O6H91_18G005500 [Diphasiastrum complanatum]KAJ7522301.1 hypothetical protein O6H91_18G005500 [Diphasiastrum complanatum]